MIVDQETWASGYRLMWMLVMFDLPVMEPEERRAATRFRNHLLDEGFEMAQFSVYYRLVSGKEAAESMIKRIEAAVPPAGVVQLLTITDKQYELIKTFRGKRRVAQKKPDQLQLF